MDNKLIYFEPVCKLKETVYHVLDVNRESPMIAVNYNISCINDKNEVVDYTVGCSFATGGLTYFKGYELQKEEVKA